MEEGELSEAKMSERSSGGREERRSGLVGRVKGVVSRVTGRGGQVVCGLRVGGRVGP